MRTFNPSWTFIDVNQLHHRININDIINDIIIEETK